MDSPIRQYYGNRSVLVTGGTGFIGKVLCEKLIRSCPEIDTIYVLLRPKPNKTAQQRLIDEILLSKAFTINNNGSKSDKLVAISGDVSEPGLGLSDEDRDRLISNVSVVFHSAASVKFHGPINDFIVQNVYGTQGVMQLCDKMTKLEALIYVSTAYANCSLKEIKERIYPLKQTSSETILKVNTIGNAIGFDTESQAMQELMEGRPNSYTFSKAIAENLVTEKFSHLPLVIVRPSIVTPAAKEPAPGWVDNINGVAGALLLGALGIARTMDINCEAKADLIPVDIICNALIVIGWHTGTTSASDRKQVIHVTSGSVNPVTWGRFLNYSRLAAQKAPSIRMVRPLANNPTHWRRGTLGKLGHANHVITKFVSHILFAYFVDALLTLLGYKRVMAKVTSRMHRAFEVLEHFTNKEWVFDNRNYFDIYDRLSDDDQQLYSSDVRRLDWKDYAWNLYFGTRRYLLKEDDSNIEKAQKRLNYITVFYNIFLVTLWALLLFMVYRIYCIIV
ncbi:fatty acyl-CoA reductase 1-like [Oppia nitens]|uniref:fatty acyl-CoA reductase 1-like n=1 Tax=Oppia nitens TaxID=1686743 RepID=UPI0023DAE9BD|nr:fatty acyl-CoA reductase 1-like [Oppia nitens]